MKNKTPGRTVFIVILILLLVVFLHGALFISFFFVSPIIVMTNDMEPTYRKGQYVWVNKFAYIWSAPVKGDLIVGLYSGSNFAGLASQSIYIDRVVAIPNDTIQLKDGAVYVNDQFLYEVSLDPLVYSYPDKFTNDEVQISVPQDQYMLLGDNQNYKSDPRSWRFTHKDVIKGKATFCYWRCGAWW